jgi:rubrerythrin
MLSENDYREYLDQIEKIEKDMRDTYFDCLEDVEEEKFYNMLQKLFEDEKAHIGIVGEIRELLGL